MAISDSVNALFLSILGRPADAATLTADVAAVSAGMTLSQLAASLANSPEAAADINTAFQAELGHGTDPASTAAAQAYLATGGSLAGERFFLAASQEGQSDIIAAYQSAFGRAPTAAELNIQTYALANGSLASLQASLVSEQAGIQSIYAAVLGRAPTATGLAAAEGAITGGQSVAAFTSQLVTSAINYVYVAELGRAATAAELSAAQGAVSAGGTIAALRGQLAMSAEAQADIGVIYQQVLGRAPSAADLAGSEQVLANGGALFAAAYNAPGTGLLTLASGALALLPATGSTVANANSVAGQLINGSEAVGDITAAYQNAAETAPSAVELASAQSELNSGVTINQIRSEIDELAGGRQPQYIGFVQITPQSLAGAPGMYVYSALNDDAVITSNAALIDVPEYGSANLTGFNAATDTVQLQSGQFIDPYAVPDSAGPYYVPPAPPPASYVVAGLRVTPSQIALTLSGSDFGNNVIFNGLSQLYAGNVQTVTTRTAPALQAAILNDYQAVFGRPPTAAELAAAMGSLSGMTQQQFTAALAAETTVIQTIYANALGRAPTANDLTAGESSLAQNMGSVGGTLLAISDLRRSLGVSAEAVADIKSIYATIFANALYPLPVQLSTDEALLVNGGSLYAAQTNPQGHVTTASGAAAALAPPNSTGPVVGSVAFGAIVQLVAGSYPGLNGVETAALQSLLFSGVSASLVLPAALGVKDNSATLPGSPFVTITPQTLSGLAATVNIDGAVSYTPSSQPPTYIYGLFNNDSLISSNGSLGDVLDFDRASGSAVITGFNPATDVLQYQASEGYSGPSTTTAPVIGGVQVTANGSSTVVHLSGGAAITLAGVAPTQLSAPNFQLVPNQVPPVTAPV